MSWEKVKLEDVLSYEQPTKYIVETDKYDSRYKTPVLTAGKSFVLGYTNEVGNIFQDFPVIIFDDFTTAIKYVDFPFKVKSSAMKILKANEEISDVRYLFHKMSTLKIDKELHKRYWISKYSQIEIPLPPLHIQKQIAEILDKADALRKKDLELLKRYDALAESLFIDMFGDPVKNEKGWEIKKLEDFIQSLDAGVSVNSTDEIPTAASKCVLKTSCVSSGTFNYEQAKVILKDDLMRAKLNPIKDSIIISRMNTIELVGKSAYVNKDFPNLYLPDRLWQTTKGTLEHSVLWLSYSLSFHSFFNDIVKIASGTSGSMKNISKKSFLNLNIIYPPISLQNQFAELIRNIELQKEKVKAQIKASENLFQALLQKVFN